MKSLRVILADDHPVVCSGIRNVLIGEGGFNVVAIAKDGKEAVELCEKLLPDIILMDISMPRLNGIDATRHIRKRCPPCKVVIISMYTDQEYVKQVLSFGASGYISKNESIDNFPHILRTIAEGRTYVSQEISQVLIDLVLETPTEQPSNLLTMREREILQLIVNGLSNRDMANELNLSKGTVERHRTNLMRKLDIHDKVTLVRYAKEHKLVSIPNPEQIDLSEGK